MALPIRFRLTIWYSGLLLLMLVGFGAAMYFRFLASLEAAVDLELEDRLHGLEHFMETEMPRFPRERLWREFEESVELRPGEMLQISLRGEWIFRSRAIQRLELTAPIHVSRNVTTSVLHSTAVRLLTASVTVNGETYSVQLAASLGPPYEAVHRLLGAMLGLIPLLVLAASLGGYWLSRRALAPVDRIIADSRSIGHHNLSQRLMVPKSGDELQRLSETLNEMIARLETAFQQITRFTADASHELRSPVAFIRARAEIALLKPRCAETYRSAVEDMYGEATRMTELIQNLLTLARADSGAAQLAMVPIDLREPIRFAATHGQSLAEGKSVSFWSKVPDSPVRVLGDATALRRLFLILIENAIKYTPARGRVDVGLATTSTSVVLTVRDTGIGIAQEDLDRIFERFYRSDKARQRDSGGTGLGLSIARWIADAHGAQLEVQSELGFGSTFSVRLARAS